MRILEGACPNCGGDIYIDYKHGKLWKCIKCSKIFTPKSKEVLACLKYSVAKRQEPSHRGALARREDKSQSSGERPADTRNKKAPRG